MFEVNIYSDEGLPEGQGYRVFCSSCFDSLIEAEEYADKQEYSFSFSEIKHKIEIKNVKEV